MAVTSPPRASDAGPPTALGGKRPSQAGAGKRTTHLWARRLHVYTSMVALLITLFFGLTGLTLNHPSWTFGDEVSVTTTSGTLPFDVISADGAVDYLAIAEFVRSDEGVTGEVDSYGASNGEGSIAFKNPGYSADVFFDTETGEYQVTTTQQGFVAVMNDLHKGRDSGSAWRWVIDISAGFLVLISISGLVMQFFLKKRRTAALTSAAAGGVLTIILIILTLA